MQEVAGLADREFLSYLRMAARMRLVMPDEAAADWYSFRHPLTIEALLAQLTRTRLAEVAARVADAVEASYPDLAGEWCQRVAALRLAAGEPAAAGMLFAEAGRRALADGAAGSAIPLFERAERLLDESGERLDVLLVLVPALLEAGRFDDAQGLVSSVAPAAHASAAADATRLLRGAFVGAAARRRRAAALEPALHRARGRGGARAGGPR